MIGQQFFFEPPLKTAVLHSGQPGVALQSALGMLRPEVWTQMSVPLALALVLPRLVMRMISSFYTHTHTHAHTHIDTHM